MGQEAKPVPGIRTLTPKLFFLRRKHTFRPTCSPQSAVYPRLSTMSVISAGQRKRIAWVCIPSPRLT